MKGSVNGGAGIVVAIDGEAGTGKSSVAKKLATSLRWDYLETGALYRGVALLMDREGKDSKDIDDALSSIDIERLGVLLFTWLSNYTIGYTTPLNESFLFLLNLLNFELFYLL